MNQSIAQQIADQGGVEAYLHAQQHKSLLRFLTCGSVDDGKSTLIGRLLHDTRQIYEDQLSTLHNDSKRLGTQGKKLDLALLVDGLQASVSRVLPLMSPTAISPRKDANSLSPIPPVMSSTPVTWQPGLDLRSGDPVDRCAQRRTGSNPSS